MTAGKTGAIEIIVEAIKIHMNNAGVCYRGCGALSNITINNGKQIKRTIKLCTFI